MLIQKDKHIQLAGNSKLRLERALLRSLGQPTTNTQTALRRPPQLRASHASGLIASFSHPAGSSIGENHLYTVFYQRDTIFDMAHTLPVCPPAKGPSPADHNDPWPTGPAPLH